MNKKEIAGGLLVGLALYGANKVSPEPVKKEFAKFNSSNDISQEYTRFIHNSEAVPLGGTPLLGTSQQHKTNYLIENTDARGAELDVHNEGGELVVRHGEYEAIVGKDPPKLKEVLEEISEALDKNPRAFVIKIDDHSLDNNDKTRALNEVETHFSGKVWDASDQSSYASSHNGAWPSENHLISSDKPIIIQNHHRNPVGYSADWLPEYLENEDRTLTGRLFRSFDIDGAVDRFSVENTPEMAQNGGSLNFDNMQPQEARHYQRSAFDPKMSMFSALTPYSPQSKDGNASMFGFSGALASLAAIAGVSVLNKEQEKKRKEKPYNNDANKSTATKVREFVDDAALPVSAIGKAALQAGSMFPEHKYTAMSFVAAASVGLLVANQAFKAYQRRSESDDMEQTLPHQDLNIELPQVREQRNANRSIYLDSEEVDYSLPPRPQEQEPQSDLYKPDYDKDDFQRAATAGELQTAIENSQNASWDTERVEEPTTLQHTSMSRPAQRFNDISAQQLREEAAPDSLAAASSFNQEEMATNLEEAAKNLERQLQEQNEPQAQNDLFKPDYDANDYARTTTSGELREAIDTANNPTPPQRSELNEQDDDSQRTAKTPEQISIERARGTATALVATMALSSIRGDDEYESRLGTSIASAGISLMFGKAALKDMGNFIRPEKDGDSRAMAGFKAGVKMATAAMTIAQHSESKTISKSGFVEGACVVAATACIGAATLSLVAEGASKTIKKASESVSHVTRLAQERLESSRNPRQIEI